MRRLIMLSPVVLFTVLSVSALVSLSVLLSTQIKEVEHMQALRSQIKMQIHDTLHRQYDAQILETRLLGRCGITAYIVTLRDAAGSESTLYFDIDNGMQIHHNLLNGCPRRMSGSVTTPDVGTNTGI